jgi:hypothetical protein
MSLGLAVAIAPFEEALSVAPRAPNNGMLAFNFWLRTFSYYFIKLRSLSDVAAIGATELFPSENLILGLSLSRSVISPT